ncbi:hypothetical protein [Streptomyces prasinus]|uniref:Uncharacterized protein n=1 Tax=Streptomyces prasinus TaxID=67345 RepID=A0ABX6B8K9_9ACTN|nr:hypothetical protein [Streptomyces prasinus]QEV10107.1 hypothetical protein CP972_07520 [Streptomyces prasinus]
MRVADPGGEHRHGAPDVVHRLAQPGRRLPGLLRVERRPRRFGSVVLVLVVLAHGSIALSDGGPDQGVRSRGREQLPPSSPRPPGETGREAQFGV